jgi:crossover junction endodeoxyribonuclease RuvC
MILLPGDQLITFDLSSSTGYAVGPVGGVPKFGTHQFPSTGSNVGRHQANARAWQRRMLLEHDPKAVAYEQPSLFGKTTPQTVIKLSCVCSTLEELCLREAFGKPCFMINPSQLKKFWTGNGRAKKPDMVAQAKRFGFSVQTDDEADAVAMWFFMIEMRGSPETKDQFRQMRFEAGMGVQQGAKF